MPNILRRGSCYCRSVAPLVALVLGLDEAEEENGDGDGDGDPHDVDAANLRRGGNKQQD